MLIGFWLRFVNSFSASFGLELATAFFVRFFIFLWLALFFSRSIHAHFVLCHFLLSYCFFHVLIPPSCIIMIPYVFLLSTCFNTRLQNTIFKNIPYIGRVNIDQLLNSFLKSCSHIVFFEFQSSLCLCLLALVYVAISRELVSRF